MESFHESGVGDFEDKGIGPGIRPRGGIVKIIRVINSLGAHGADVKSFGILRPSGFRDGIGIVFQRLAALAQHLDFGGGGGANAF